VLWSAALSLPGCAGENDAPIAGRWVTSTAPELADSRVVMTFKESGEFQYSSPFMLFGKPVTVEAEGKNLAARLDGSGTWSRQGNNLKAQILQTNQPATSFPEPSNYTIKELTDQKLVLEFQGEKPETIALFREEQPPATKAP
jgi:hypothetical protein